MSFVGRVRRLFNQDGLIALRVIRRDGLSH
jgi:hypothetical protein